MASDSVLRRRFGGDPRELAGVRSFVRARLPGCPVLDDAVLLLDELAGNAIVHTESETIEVSLRHAAGIVRGEVLDAGGATAPVPDRSPDPGAEGGRGLFLVSLIAVRWGTHRTPAGRVVWFELYDPGCREMARVTAA